MVLKGGKSTSMRNKRKENQKVLMKGIGAAFKCRIPLAMTELNWHSSDTGCSKLGDAGRYKERKAWNPAAENSDQRKNLS